MEVLQPRSLAGAIAAKAEYPAAVPIAGGTAAMVAGASPCERSRTAGPTPPPAGT